MSSGCGPSSSGGQARRIHLAASWGSCFAACTAASPGARGKYLGSASPPRLRISLSSISAQRWRTSAA
eukprot:3436807-Lingulodinium_polyedra.AAC.1